MIASNAITDPVERFEAEIEQLGVLIDASLMRLNSRQNKYVRLLIEGGENGKPLIKQDMVKLAGYSESNPELQVFRLSKNEKVQEAILLMRRRAAYMSSIHAGFKRMKLIGLIETTSNPESKGFHPAACVNAIKLLCQLDSDISPPSRSNTSAAINIVINTGITRENLGTVIEGQAHHDDNEAIE